MKTPVELPWLLENDRVTRWYYRDAPTPGSIVRYTHETYIDVVSHVTLTHVWLVSGRALLRPFIARRLVRWTATILHTAWQRRSRMLIQQQSSKPSPPAHPNAIELSALTA